MILRKLSQSFKITLALMLSVLSSGILQAAPAYATGQPDGVGGGPDPKVFVCKYVGTPGVDEELQPSENNPISVSVNAIPDYQGVGSYFADGQNRSYVLSEDTRTGGGQTGEPDISECPAPDDGGDDVVTPLPLGVGDVCGPNNDTVPGADTETYTVESDSGWINNSRTITYRAADGFIFSASEGWTVSADGKTAAYTYTDWSTPCNVNPCAANYNAEYKMWEITWGLQHTDNGAPTFDMESYGGLVSINNAPVPDYMTAGWHWLYVNEANVQNGRTVTYGFADGTVITAVVSADSNNCPSVEWTTTPPPTPVICVDYPNVHSTNTNQNGWVLGSGATYVTGGMKLSVLGDWDTSTISRTMSGPLSSIGTGYDFSPNVQYLGLHVSTTNGTLVYEKHYENQDPANAGKWWSWGDFNVSGGQGYPTFDTLENILAMNPGVTITGLTVLYTNPDPANVTLTSATIGCATYTFGLGNVLGDDDEKPVTPVTPTGGQGGGKVLATSTVLPAMLPATGAKDSPYMILVAALIAYGATYFIQGRRKLLRNEA